MNEIVYRHAALSEFYRQRVRKAPEKKVQELQDLIVLHSAIELHPEREAVLMRFAMRAGDPAFLRFFRVMAVENSQYVQS